MSNKKTMIDADQTEIEALLNSFAPLDAGISDDRQASALDSIDTLDSSSWIARDAELDNLGSEVTTEINYRSILLDDAYPFIIENNCLKLKELSINYFYIFCLILSNSPLKANKGEPAYNQLMTRLFERTTLNIICNSLGNLCKGHHFGFPRDNNTGIIDAINNLQQDLSISKEWKFSPFEYVNAEVSKQKDLGIDQIIWIKRPDKRTFSHLYFLGQCACGDDYLNKFNDIDLKKLTQYFHPLTHTSPIKMMSIPFVLSDNEFQRISNCAGWLFDRISLSSIYNQHEDLKEMYNQQIIDIICQSTPYGERFKKSNLYQQIIVESM